MGSTTSSYLRNAGKLGTTKGTENRSSRYPGEICITLLAATVDGKAAVSGNSEFPTQTILKEDTKAFSNMKQKESSNNPPGGEHERLFVQSHDGSPHQGMGQTAISWTRVLPNLNKKVPQTEPINNNMKKINASIVHVGNSILAAAVEAGIN